MSIDDSTWSQVRQMREQLARIEDDHTRTMAAAWARAWDEVSDDLNLALNELALQAGDEKITRSAVLKSERLRKGLDAIQGKLNALFEQSGQLAIDSLDDVVNNTGLLQERLIGLQLPPAERGMVNSWSSVSPDQIEAIVLRSTEQITKLSFPLSDQATATMRRELVRGLVGGDNPRTVAARMIQRTEGLFNGGLSRALTIARTETLTAHRTASQMAEKANADILSCWIWSSAMSTRTCPACWGMNGEEFPLDVSGPDGHQNCLVAGAVITGPRAQASTTRWFDGEVIELQVAGRDLLTVTPNHPILTPHGWVAAGELSEGDQVVTGSGRKLPTVGRGPDDHQIPALIEDVAESLGGTSPVRAVSVPTSAEDFHGDGAGSDVHVVRTNRFLRNDDQASLGQVGSESEFMVRNVSLALLSRGGPLRSFLDAALPTSDRLVRRDSVGSVLLGGAHRHHQPIRLGLAAQGHTCILESSVDRVARHSIDLREDLSRLAGQVPPNHLHSGQVALRENAAAGVVGAQHLLLRGRSPQATVAQDAAESNGARSVPSRDEIAAFAGEVVVDRVLHVGRRRWSGHVYNLQTATGWYVANGIVTHNCRCSRVSKTKTWKELGFDIPEPPSLLPDSKVLFDELPQVDQLAVLGRGRFDAWKAGDFPMSDWATKQSNPGWRDSYVTSKVPARR